MKNYDKFYAVMSMIQGDKILINEVRKYPFIYDQKHENYKDMKLKEDTWNTIGAAINVKPCDAKNRWRNLRDRYVREKKMLLTEGEEVYRRHEVWPYLEDMSFLWDLIVHRKLPRFHSYLEWTIHFFLPAIPVAYLKAKEFLTKSKNSVSAYYRCSNSSYQINGDENSRKLNKIKLKNDLRNLPPLIPKPMQDWLNSNLNGGTITNGICLEAASANGQNNDVIEVDPWACSINEQNQNDDDLKPSQSKLRKLLSEHQEDSRGETPNSNRSCDYSPLLDATNPHKSIQPFPPIYDEDELFCLSVAASLKRFTCKTKASTKIKIQQLLYDAEFNDEQSIIPEEPNDD